METENTINLPASNDSGIENENNKLHTSDCGPTEADSQPSNFEDKEDNINRENMGWDEGEIGNEDHHCIDMDLVDSPPIKQVRVEFIETATVEENLNSSSKEAHTANGRLTLRDESLSGASKMDGSPMSGVKRARKTFDEKQPSVHVIYNYLTRASKQKLEELLQKWSAWHAQHVSSYEDPNRVLESGEETFFPAIHVGTEKSSAVSFWMDNQTGKQQSMEFIPLDGNSVPLYDRGYALGLTSADGLSNVEGGLEIIDDATRCFNCRSYNHSFKECPRPRDNVAVNNARKQRKFKRNQNTGSRNPTRYYQNSPGGKYDGLRPGALDSETRKLLGLGELDPPPWLNRMREMGYPPGYLDPEDEEEPSGIMIFADDEIKEEQEDGEIIETDVLEPHRKMSVEFPGINAPIPENADERRWGAGSSSSDPYRNRSHHRGNHYSEPSSRGHQREQRWSRDLRDDGPPGCDPVLSPSVSSYPPRYGGYDSSYTSYSPRSNIPRSPIFGRSLSDRGRNPVVIEGSLAQDSYGSPYLSPRDYGSARFESRNDDPNLLSDGNVKHDRYHPYRR